ncbi:MAG: hypothetical protein WAU86_11060 [Oricola sp.]
MTDKKSIFFGDHQCLYADMKQILYILGFRRRPPVPAPLCGTEWASDPLSHPAIRAMRPDELADLPFRTARDNRR